MGDELQQRLSQEDAFNFSPSDHMAYFNLTGTPKAKASISKFLQKWFSNGIDVPEDEVQRMTNK